MANCVDLMLKASSNTMSKVDAQQFIHDFSNYKAEYVKNAGGFNAADLTKELQTKAQERLHNELVGTLREKYQAHIAKGKAAELESEARIKGDKQQVGPIHGLIKSIFDYGKVERSATQGVLSRLERGMKAEGVWDHWNQGTSTKDAFREVAELNTKGGKPGVTNNPIAVKMAKVIQPLQKELMNRANRAGALITEHDGYVTRRVYDGRLTDKLGFNEFQKEAMNRFDLQKMFKDGTSPQDIQDSLKNTFNGIVSGKHGKEFENLATQESFRGPTNKANKLSAARSIFYKSPEDEYEFLKKFGPTENIANLMTRNLDSLARKVSLIEKFGPNPENVLDHVFGKLQGEHQETLHQGSQDWDRSADKTPGNALKKLLDKAKPNDSTLFKWAKSEVMGETREPGSRAQASSIKNTMDYFRVLVNTGSLGKALFSAQSDLGNASAFLRSIGHEGSFGDVLKSYYSRMEQNEKNLKDAGYYAGVAGDSVMHGLVDTRFSAEDLRSNGAKGLQEAFIKYTGIFSHDTRIKNVLAHFMRYHFGKNAGNDWASLPQELRSTFERYDINPTEWDAWRSQAYDDLNGRKLLDRQYTDIDKHLDPLVTGAKTDANYKRALDKLDGKIGSIFADASDHAVPRTGIKERTYMYMGTKADSGAGYFLRLLMQLRTFPIAQASKNVALALQSGKGGISGLGYLLAVSTFYGLLGNTAKSLVSGQTPTNPLEHPVKATLQAMTGGGGLGFLGDVLFPNPDEKGADRFANLLLGPVLGKAGNVYAAASDLAGGHGKQAATEAINTAFHMIPFNNHYATHYLLNYLVKNPLLEMVSPGHTERMQKYNQKERGSQFFLPPSLIGSGQ